MSKQKILVIEDDQQLCGVISVYLENAGYEVVANHTGNDIPAIIKNNNFDLILVDILLPGEQNGIELTTKIRETSDVPVIFLTQKTEIEDKLQGFDAGADDYITKPFDEKELLARIRTVLRRVKNTANNGPAASQASFAGWELNLIDRTLRSPDGKQIDITSSEYQVLAAMVNRPNVVITRDEIIRMISVRYWSPLDRSADMIISKLRRKIEKDSKKPTLIKTIRNKGYQLTTTVKLDS